MLYVSPVPDALSIYKYIKISMYSPRRVWLLLLSLHYFFVTSTENIHMSNLGLTTCAFHFLHNCLSCIVCLHFQTVFSVCGHICKFYFLYRTGTSNRYCLIGRARGENPFASVGRTRKWF